MAMPTRTARPTRPQVQSRPAVTGQPPPTPMATAQGRSIVNQGGQQGVVGRGGNFQALGNAALRRAGQNGPDAPAGVGGGPYRDPGPGGRQSFGGMPGPQSPGMIRTMPWQPTPDMPMTTKPMPWEPPIGGDVDPAMATQFMDRLRGGGGAGPGQAEGAGIGPAIQSLRSQLGMLPQGQGQGQPQPMTGGGLTAGAPPNVRSMMKPYFGGDETGGADQMARSQNPYAMLLKQRLAGAGGGAGVGAGMLPAMANYAR